jgi:putative sigma-54 modulation protein
MRLEISGLHYEVSQATKDHIMKKTEHFDRFDSIITDMHVTMQPLHVGYEVSIHVHFSWHGATPLHIKRSDKNLWVAIDEVFEALGPNISKIKSKHVHVDHEKMEGVDLRDESLRTADQ